MQVCLSWTCTSPSVLQQVCDTTRIIIMFFMVIVLCAGLVSAAPGQQPRDESLNYYIDLVMDNLQVVIIEGGYDPVALPNTSMGFSDVVLGVEWYGEASLYDGWMRGLGSIHRSHDANFIRNAEGRIIGMEAGLGLGDMKGHYTCLAKFMDLGPVADVYIDVNGADIRFEAVLDTQACVFQAEAMEVTHLGNISVSIDGLGALGWILGMLIDFVMIFISGFISNIVETVVKGLANDALNSTDLGILGPILGCQRGAIPMVL